MRLAKTTDIKNNFSKIKEAIISQLVVASPASLPMDFITTGVAYVIGNAFVNDVKKILDELEHGGVVIKITECSSACRYKLVEHDQEDRVKEDE